MIEGIVDEGVATRMMTHTGKTFSTRRERRLAKEAMNVGGRREEELRKAEKARTMLSW